MAAPDTLWQELAALTRWLKSDQRAVDRISAQIKFAACLCDLHPDRAPRWHKLLKQALADATKALTEDLGVSQAIARAESALAPLAKVAKQYTIHCVGHGHIDMNWMWDWPETVATVNDTFTTVDRLMEEFPNFHYSQSQASVYQIMKDYLPELYARVKQRIAEGRWEVTATTWVEGSKNLASGEAMCRQLLYTNRFFQHELGFAPDAVKMDWECDTFGHPHTIPTILSQAGVSRYYFHRGSTGPQLFWWQGVDGSRVLAFDDRHRGYNGRFSPEIIGGMREYLQATGLKDWLFVFGVGDHGGGPTRHDLLQSQEMNTWPIFPTIKLSTTDAFFSAVEKAAPELPVLDQELNFVFEGCYTSESTIKFANRKSENALVEAEAIGLLAQPPRRRSLSHRRPLSLLAPRHVQPVPRHPPRLRRQGHLRIRPRPLPGNHGPHHHDQDPRPARPRRPRGHRLLLPQPRLPDARTKACKSARASAAALAMSPPSAPSPAAAATPPAAILSSSSTPRPGPAREVVTLRLWERDWSPQTASSLPMTKGTPSAPR